MASESGLQPLQVPAGWSVQYNAFPAVMSGDDLKEDLLQLRHEKANRLLDVGWYPEGDPDGAFLVTLHEGDFLGPCLHRFRSALHEAAVREIERLLLLISGD